jgi:DNA-binding SARP family transcriptional activator/Tfp pilus assembly protein PilF
MEGIFRLRLLGTVQVEQDGEPMRGFRSRKALALLGYLAMQNQPVPREHLADMFWGDQPEARGRANLSWVLNRISTLLPGCIQADRHTVQFQRTPSYWLDLDAFAELETQDEAVSLATAMELYRGEFLEGLYLDGCAEFEIWLVGERERWRQRVTRVLGELIAHHSQCGEYQEGLWFARRLLMLEPWRENTHRQVMRLLAHSGQRGAALAQYETCSRVLAEELGVEPAQETTRLYEQIRDGEWKVRKQEDRPDQVDEKPREMRDRQRIVNLRPLDVAHFKDRLCEIQALCDHLADPSVRLVSVVGRGGMGKTALVCRVLASLEQGKLPLPAKEREFPIDGILYLSARSTGLDLERIHADVGRMLGEPAASQLATHWADRHTSLRAKVEYLLETMRDGLYLIILDNLEDELSEDGSIAEEGLRLFVQRCLTHPGGARLIATSRKEVKVPAAALLGARCVPLREGLPEAEAVAMLQDLDPQGVLGLRHAPENDLHRAALLTRGIPRALEILAGILDRNPTASLPKLLATEDTFGAQVVEQLVAEGYRHLEEHERRIMEALSVFDRPVNETAVTYLLHPWWPGLDIRAGLHHLVNSHFVSASRVTGEYSLHPLDRDYAYHRLSDDKEPDAYNRRNLELCAADFYTSIRKPESEWKTINDLAPQLTEFEHRIRGGDYNGACQILEPIDFEYLSLWGHYARLIELRERLLERLTDRGLEAINLSNLGRANRNIGRVERAIEFHKQALEITRQINDHRWEGTVLGYLGSAYRDLGQVDRAIEFHEQALTITQDMGERRWEGIWLGSLAYSYHTLGQVERAVELYEQSVDIAHEVGDAWGEGQRLGNLGHAYRDLGQADRAIELHEQALLAARETGSRWGEEINLGNLAKAYYDLGQVEQAIEFYENALAIAREIGDRLEESYQLLGLGRVLLTTGELTEAQQCCVEALTLEVPVTSYRAALVLGIISLREHDPAARDAFADAVARCQAILDKTTGLYEARYALTAALVGQTVCDPRWADENEQAGLLAPALGEYRRALENCAAPGVVRDAFRDLEMIRAAGIEGLEPVFEAYSVTFSC